MTHARNHPHTDLVVVDQIGWQVGKDGTYSTRGGWLRAWTTWRPADDLLSPTRYLYELPENPDIRP